MAGAITLTIEKNTEILEMLDAAKQQLQEAGIASCECDAQALLMFVLGVDRVDLYTGDLDISDGHRLFFESFIRDRMRGMPLQYITGKTEFFGLPFFVCPGVFIPRPETEILVDAVIRHCEPRRGEACLAGRQAISDEIASVASLPRNGVYILDLCTGSGNIAICLAKHINYAKIIATDISKKAIELARKNAADNKVEARIEFKRSDLFEGLDFQQKFDVIVSNSPYIRRADLKLLPLEVRREPIGALNGGKDGLHFYRKIIGAAAAFLNKDGFLAMELGDGQAEAVEEIVRKTGFFGSAKIVKDSNQTDRVLIVQCGVGDGQD